jgi:galactose-1-phosphate uridylyltransferase
MNNPKSCPFCQIISGAIDKTILFENETGFVVRDGFPITQGHTLIIPKQHIGSFFDISQSQRQDLFALVDLAKAELDQLESEHVQQIYDWFSGYKNVENCVKVASKKELKENDFIPISHSMYIKSSKIIYPVLKMQWPI